MTLYSEFLLGQATLCGPKEENQDFYGVVTPHDTTIGAKGVVAVIADGVSQCAAGREASEHATKSFLFDYLSTPDSWDTKTSGRRVIGAINSWLYSQGTRDGCAGGLLTTLSGVVIRSNTAHLFHIGDTRISLLRAGALRHLTHDHRVDLRGGRSYLGRVLGADIDIAVDYRAVPLEEGDLLVMTSDGIHDYLADEALLALLMADSPSFDQVANDICTAALVAQSDDNMTCQLLKIVSLPSQTIDDAYDRLGELPFPPELEPGMTLDGYVIERELSLSATSQLYVAHDSQGGRVVIKTPSVNYEDDLAYLERFQLEEWVGKRLDNPHVVKVKGQSGARSCLYYTIEYLEGITLRDWIDQRNYKGAHPAIEETLSLLEQVVAGLRAFHRKGMTHRDLKPENIFICSDGVVKLIDFGSVKVEGIHEVAVSFARTDLVGTKNYTAPEYLLGSAGSPLSDHFSLGVIAYEMLTGHLPFDDDLGRDVTHENIQRLFYRVSYHRNPLIPLWMDGALKKMTAPIPRNRYAAISEFLYDMRNPNRLYMNHLPAPMLERNPLTFWKVLVFLLCALNAVLFFLLLAPGSG